MNQQAQDGRTQNEAMSRLMEVLGLNYPVKEDNERKEAGEAS